MYSPWGRKSESAKKRVPGRILKNGSAQWIPESPEKVHPEGT